MIRVVIAEDSPRIRDLLGEILRADPDIRVVGEAQNGVEAVEITRALHPDVVTMDIRMPRMDGFEATKEIMQRTPTPIVILSEPADVREMAVSMHALRLGALTLLLKPSVASPDFEKSSRQFVSTVKAMSRVKVARRQAVTPEAKPPKTRPASAQQASRAQLVAIAASIGGPSALHEILSVLPRDFGVPIMVVQHIGHGFTKGVADWLDTLSPVRVKVAEHREPLSPGVVYFAPEDRHLGVANRSTVLLSDAPPRDTFRPSGSFLFESVASVFGSSALGVILTGMGNDGVAGLEAVQEAGGRIIAQDEASSVVFGMPSAAIEAGLADLVLSPSAVATRLIEMVGGSAS